MNEVHASNRFRRSGNEIIEENELPIHTILEDDMINNITIEINDNETEAQRLGRMIKYLRLSTGMKREDFANYFHIPLGTVRDWEQGKRKMPEYVYELIEYKATKELLVEREDNLNGKE